MHLEEMIEYNKKFVADKEYIQYETDKYPNKRMVIFTYMESSLVELLPRALNIQNGDVKMLKNAGAIIRKPFDSIMKSVLIAVHNLRAEQVLVVGHYDCGMAKINTPDFIKHMLAKGISEQTIHTIERAGINIDEEFSGFATVEESIMQTVSIIKNHPLLPEQVKVHGLAIDPGTGKVDVICRDQ